MSEPWSTYVAYPVTVYCKMRLPGDLPRDDRPAALSQEVMELWVQLSLDSALVEIFSWKSTGCSHPRQTTKWPMIPTKTVLHFLNFSPIPMLPRYTTHILN